MLYRVMGDAIKPHVMNDEQVMLDVFENLTDRFGDREYTISRDLKKKEFFWDPGGALYNSPTESRFSFDLGGFVVTVRSQHWFQFVQCVRKNLVDTTYAQEVYGGSFFKLHGEFLVACLSKDQANQLLAQIYMKSGEYDSVAREQWGHLKSFGDEAWYDEYLLKQQGKVVALR